MADVLETIRGENAVAAIDFHQTVFYVTDAAPGQRPDGLVASYPHGHSHKVHHHSEFVLRTKVTVGRTGTN
jgi:hypothetical protein